MNSDPAALAGDATFAFDFTQAYMTGAAEAVSAPGFSGNYCEYYPIQDGNLDCTDTPYFAYEPALGGSPYYLDDNDWGSETPNAAYLRQSGYFAIVQTAPAPGPTSVPGPLPVLGLLVTWRASRKIRKRLNASKASTAHRENGPIARPTHQDDAVLPGASSFYA